MPSLMKGDKLGLIYFIAVYYLPLGITDLHLKLYKNYEAQFDFRLSR